jgi:tRNA(fMet)-specific endonuclease VapC
MLYVLDTDHLSLLQRRSPEGKILLQRLQANQVAFSATVISYEEQTRGWMGHLAKAKNTTEQVIAYDRLRQHAVNYCNIPLLGFDESAIQTNQQLRKRYPRLGAMDLKIAAIVLTQDVATLLTRNTRDFGQIEGLSIDDWSID